MDKPKAIVIGSGVGGLGAAAKLAQTGQFDVSVYERLSFAGGRFTQHDHDGFQIPTGAVHMIPHGLKGPFAKLMLGKKGAGGLDLGRHGVEFLPTSAYACQIKNNKVMSANSPLGIMKWFPVKNTLNLPRLLATRANKPWDKRDLNNGKLWMKKYFTDDFIDFMDAFWLILLPFSVLLDLCRVCLVHVCQNQVLLEFLVVVRNHPEILARQS